MEYFQISVNKNFLTLLLTTESAGLSEDLNTSLELVLFLVKYAFLTDSYITSETILKRQNPSHGELFFKNSNGARYLDPKYSRWISVDPALGEYVPSAGKGNASDAGNLPGMGGIYNSVNGNLYHYAGNNPIRYVDPDGREDEIVSKKEMWIAKEYFLSFGVDERIGDKGLTEMYGKAIVFFSNGKTGFIKEFDVIIDHSYGYYLTGSVSGTKTLYFRTFPSGVSDREVIDSYEGIFASKNAGYGNFSVGTVYSISTETYDIDPEGWKGISRGLSVSIGGPISYGIQFSVYRDPSKLQNDFSDHPEWFPWKNQNQLWLTRGQGNVKK